MRARALGPGSFVWIEGADSVVTMAKSLHHRFVLKALAAGRAIVLPLLEIWPETLKP